MFKEVAENDREGKEITREVCLFKPVARQAGNRH